MLNRLELSRPEPSRYHKASHDPAAIEGLFVDLFRDAHAIGGDHDLAHAGLEVSISVEPGTAFSVQSWL